MYKTPAVGRNDPCPCGSGLKYKRCCLGKQQNKVTTIRQPTYFDLEIDWGGDYFELNRAIAYKGTIGRKREAFCEAYLKYKQAKFIETNKDLIAQAKAENSTITCEKGCSACCSLYHEAIIQECELIVYYLLHNKEAYSKFLNNYSRWRQRVRQGGDIFKRAEQYWQQLSTEMSQVKHFAQFLEIQKSNSEKDEQIREDYEKQVIPCPFLDNQFCSIYEVRPYTCAGHVTTTPKEWCDPLNSMHTKVTELHYKPLEITEQVEFYYKNLGGPVFTFTPVVVYEILKGGFSYLSRLPGFKLLAQKVVRDPEINSTYVRYGQQLPEA
ncbi:MAG: SEC-C domain-containing protein [Dehalococcoidia bacterium]|nr:SEC-C domain-containing protein [Dehalococcoidia bacterium]